MAEPRYQAFLSHNSADKPAVEELARRLERESIACWLDRWNLIPGEAWRPALERGIRQSETCLIFVGPSGFGQWHTEEMDLAIREGVERKPRALRVLPVLLPGGKEVAAAELPGFLKGKTWVQFSQSLNEPEAFRRLVCGIRGVAPGPAAEQAPFADCCPYVGLRPFRAEEAPFFFGREGIVRQLLTRLGNWFGTRDERRFLAVLGPSGSGKSSVIAARLIPVLQRGGLPESDRWLYVSCKPGPNPWESLQVALGSHPEICPHLQAIGAQIDRSRDESARLHLAGRYALNRPDDPRRLVLFVDQFEEVFTYARRDRGQSPRDAAVVDGLGPERRLFIENLLHAISEEQGRVIVILALRADFYGHCAVLPALRTAVSDNQVLLGPMCRDELRDAIVCPAQRCGLEVEPALVERLLDDMERQPGALPFLQHTLGQLWKAREGRRLTAATYGRMGSLEGAVDRYAEDYFRSLKPDQQRLLRQVLLDLVQLGEGAADTKRRRALRDLPGGKTEDLHLFIKDLADRNLVTTSQPLGAALTDKTAGDVQVELSHEALLRGWKSFQHWIDTSRDQLRLRDRIEEAARAWKEHPKDKSYLWRGGQLAGAQVELSRSELDLSDESHAFLAACNALRQRRRCIMLGLTFFVVFAAIAATVVAIIALKLKTRALAQERVANQRLVEVFWLVAQQARGTAPVANEVSPIKATHYLLKAAGAAYLAADGAGMHNAVLAAKTQTANLVSTLLHDGPVLGATDSADGRLILTWSADGAVRLWNAADGAVAGHPMKHDRSVRGAQFSVDGQRILTWSWDGTARLWSATDGAAVGRPMEHGAAVNGAQFIADGRRILTWSDDGTARLWDATDGTAVGRPMRHENVVNGAQLSVDGRRILTWSWDGTARLWNATDGAAAGPPMEHDKEVWGARFSVDGRRILTWSNDGTARLWNVADGKAICPPMKHDAVVRGARFSMDGRRILTRSDDGTARLWDATDGSAIGRPMKHDAAVWGAEFSVDGRQILTWSGDGTARLWDATDGAPVGRPMRHDKAVNGARFIADGQQVLTWSADGTTRLWNATDGSAAGRPMKHEAAVWGAQFSDDRQRILTWNDDGTARLWSATDGLAIGRPMKHEAAINGARFIADGQRILTWSNDGTARLWNVTDGAVAGQPMRHEKEVRGAQFILDGQRILTWSNDGAARLWDATNGAAAGQPMRHEKEVWGAEFVADGQRILTWSNDGTARLWNATDGTAVGRPMKHEQEVRGARFIADEQRILTWSNDGTARLWNAVDGTAVGRPMKHENVVNGAQFGVDGRRILTWSDDGTARLWDATDGRAIGRSMKHEAAVKGAQFSIDGRRILTRSDDGTVRLWDATDGNAVGRPMKHEAAVRGARFSVDGRRILTWSDDGTARLWDATDGTAVGGSMKHEAAVRGARFIADDQWILTWSDDGTARLWNATDGSAVGRPMKHEAAVRGARFSADGQWILTWTEDGTAALWSAGDSRYIVLFRHTGAITSASFNRDKTLVLTASEDGTAQLWGISLDDRVPLEERILEFEVRSATTVGTDGQVHVLTTQNWDDRREKLLQMEIRSRLALTPAGTLRTLTEDEVTARQCQLNEIKENRPGK